MARATDEELMTMFQSGNAGAFEELFKRYKGPIFTFLIRRCGNRDTASELTQEVFTRVIHRGGTFAHQSRFSTWIYTIARNAAVDHARSSRHRQHASLDQTGDDHQALSERIPGNLPQPDRGSEAASLRDALAAAIDRLPEDQKEVFILREYHGMPFQEIAQVVDAKVGTVKSRMRYALESLRRELEPWEDIARSPQ